MNFILIWQVPIVFFQKWYVPLLSIVMIKLQVRRVLRLTKMHDYFNVPPCIICTPCIIWFRHSTSGIFRLWAFRKYIILCLSNVWNKEYTPLKQNRCIFLFILVWNIVSDLCELLCDLWPDTKGAKGPSLIRMYEEGDRDKRKQGGYVVCFAYMIAQLLRC